MLRFTVFTGEKRDVLNYNMLNCVLSLMDPATSKMTVNEAAYQCGARTDKAAETRLGLTCPILEPPQNTNPLPPPPDPIPQPTCIQTKTNARVIGNFCVFDCTKSKIDCPIEYKTNVLLQSSVPKGKANIVSGATDCKITVCM